MVNFDFKFLGHVAHVEPFRDPGEMISGERCRLQQQQKKLTADIRKLWLRKADSAYSHEAFNGHKSFLFIFSAAFRLLLLVR